MSGQHVDTWWVRVCEVRCQGSMWTHGGYESSCEVRCQDSMWTHGEYESVR